MQKQNSVIKNYILSSEKFLLKDCSDDNSSKFSHYKKQKIKNIHFQNLNFHLK